MPALPKKQAALLAFLLFSVLGVQLLAIQRPFTGHYASYQGTVMASMARNMVRENFSELLLPKTDAIIGGERSLHLNQYPLPSLIAALGVRWLGGSYEFWGRFQAVVFNLFSILLLLAITRRLFDSLTGWIAAAVFALSPYTLIYGQSFMSEASSLFFLLLGMYILLKSPSALYAVGGGFFFSIALTGRLHWLILFPVFYAVIWKQQGKLISGKQFIFTLAAFVLPMLWYGHTYFASLDAANLHTNFFIQAATQKTDNLSLLKDPGYFAKVIDMFSGQLLTPLFFPFFLAGLFLLSKRLASDRIVLIGILAAILIIFAAPYKVLKHDFYFYGTFPFICMAAAFAVAGLMRAKPAFSQSKWIVCVLVIYLGLSARYFIHPIFSSPPEEIRAVASAQVLRSKTNQDERVIIAGENSAVLAFYADRPSWQMPPSQIGAPIAEYQKARMLSPSQKTEQEKYEQARKRGVSWVEYLRGQGADYFFAPNRSEIDRVPGFTEYLESHYQSLAGDKDDYYFYKLTPSQA